MTDFLFFLISACRPADLPVLLLLVFSAVEAYYYLFYFRKLLIFKNVEPAFPEWQEAVSVIVCLRNESDNLKKLIPALLAQDYPAFEVILVADRSGPETLELVRDFARRHTEIRLLEITEENPRMGPKKNALQQGIMLASNPVLLLTDADCMPASFNWIRSMAGKFAPETDAVLGFGGYEKRTGLLNLLIQYDTQLTASQYFGMALAGRPYMGVGRNLAYRKSVFNEAGGFGNTAALLSGDDDLFINQIARSGRIQVCLDQGGTTISIPKKTWGEWFRQKVRHFSAGFYYRKSDQFQLGLFQIARAGCWLFLIYLCFVPCAFWVLLLAMVFRFGVLISVGSGISAVLENRIPMYFFPLLDLLHCLGVFAAGFRSRFFSPGKWR